MGLYGPGPYEGETLQKKRTFLFRRISINIIVAFDANAAFVNSFNVFSRFLAEIGFRTIMKLSQKASFGTKACSFGTSITLP